MGITKRLGFANTPDGHAAGAIHHGDEVGASTLDKAGRALRLANMMRDGK